MEAKHIDEGEYITRSQSLHDLERVVKVVRDPKTQEVTDIWTEKHCDHSENPVLYPEKLGPSDIVRKVGESELARHKSGNCGGKPVINPERKAD